MQGRLAAGIGGGFGASERCWSRGGVEARITWCTPRCSRACCTSSLPSPRLSLHQSCPHSLSLRASVNLKQTSRISEGQQGATVSVVRNEDPGDFRPERKRERERVTDCMSSLSEKSDRIAAATDSTAPPPVQLCGAAALFLFGKQSAAHAGTTPALFRLLLCLTQRATHLCHTHTLSLTHSHASAVQSSREEGRGSSVQHRLDTHAITNSSPSRVPPTPAHPTSSFARRQRNRLKPAYTSALDFAP